MMHRTISWIGNGIVALMFSLCGGFNLSANTIVDVNTSLGDVVISLEDGVAPITVANFLSYVSSGAYNNTIIHRSVPGFVIQAGGYDTSRNPIPQQSPIIDEPPSLTGLSNLRGTIGMARLTGDPNSATSQWFVNLADNQFLDTDSGGWAIFGHVIGNGMDVIDAIAGLPTFPFSSPFETLPLRNYTQTDFDNGVTPTTDNFVLIHSVTLVPEPASAVLAALGAAGLAISVGGMSRFGRISRRGARLRP